ncbi:hypothetical protein D3C84_1166870 [compost metagenome]
MIPSIKARVREVGMAESRTLAREALALESAEQVRQHLQSYRQALVATTVEGEY